jgi:hypothetical protein
MLFKYKRKNSDRVGQIVKLHEVKDGEYFDYVQSYAFDEKPLGPWHKAYYVRRGRDILSHPFEKNEDEVWIGLWPFRHGRRHLRTRKVMILNPPTE